MMHIVNRGRTRFVGRSDYVDRIDTAARAVPKAGDGTDLFARSYHVLYDEVLWQRCLVSYANILRHFGSDEKAADYER